MTLRSEVEASSDATAHGVDRKIGRVIHVDHVSHVDLVVRSCDDKIVPVEQKKDRRKRKEGKVALDTR